MKAKIRLETVTDVKKFVNICSNVKKPVLVRDNASHCVSGQSLMGMLYSLEWTEIWCECEQDIYNDIAQFVI